MPPPPGVEGRVRTSENSTWMRFGGTAKSVAFWILFEVCRVKVAHRKWLRKMELLKQRFWVVVFFLRVDNTKFIASPQGNWFAPLWPHRVSSLNDTFISVMYCFPFAFWIVATHHYSHKLQYGHSVLVILLHTPVQVFPLQLSQNRISINQTTVSFRVIKLEIKLEEFCIQVHSFGDGNVEKWNCLGVN